MRFTGLAQAVSAKSGALLPLAVDLSHGSGSVSYVRELSDTRSISWQFQESQLRRFALVRDRGLVGPGDELAAARAQVAEAEYADFIDYTLVEDVLGGLQAEAVRTWGMAEVRTRLRLPVPQGPPLNVDPAVGRRTRRTHRALRR
ncbi:MAG TPA: hypothetical protein VFB74_30520 [Kribbellaceae bacterium]|nr:hypothetical protein [Kribbellaceae bacterium]